MKIFPVKWNLSNWINLSQKDKDGYYIDHFYSCGPKAMELAINEYYKREGIKSSKTICFVPVYLPSTVSTLPSTKS